MTKQIPLTQGKFALVDDDDFEYLNQWKWNATQSGSTFYARRQEGIIPFKKTIPMHRQIMNTPAGMEVDHINGNGLDNRRENLRNCTHAENKRNNKRYSNNSSGYIGVDRNKGKWRAYIQVNKKWIHLGYFSDPIDAAHAYDNAAEKYHGQYANTNF